MRKEEWKKKILLSLPYVVVALLCTNLGESWRMASGNTVVKRLQNIFWDGKRDPEEIIRRLQFEWGGIGAEQLIFMRLF